MTKKELLKKLKSVPADAEIIIQTTVMPHCDCPDYCYCSFEEVNSYISDVIFIENNRKIFGEKDPLAGKVIIRADL